MRRLYRLKIKFYEWQPGEKLIYDPDWATWEDSKGREWNHRGSIWEGELAMALHYFREYKLQSILEDLGDLNEEPKK